MHRVDNRIHAYSTKNRPVSASAEVLANYSPINVYESGDQTTGRIETHCAAVLALPFFVHLVLCGNGPSRPKRISHGAGLLRLQVQ
jgi:hypothetical protein